MIDRTLLICGSILGIAIILFAGTGLLLMTDKGDKKPHFTGDYPNNERMMNGPDNQPGQFDRYPQNPEKEMNRADFSEPGRNSLPFQGNNGGFDKTVGFKHNKNMKLNHMGINGPGNKKEMSHRGPHYKEMNKNGTCNYQDKKSDKKSVILTHICCTKPDPNGNVTCYITKTELN